MDTQHFIDILHAAQNIQMPSVYIIMSPKEISDAIAIINGLREVLRAAQNPEVYEQFGMPYQYITVPNSIKQLMNSVGNYKILDSLLRYDCE